MGFFSRKKKQEEQVEEPVLYSPEGIVKSLRLENELILEGYSMMEYAESNRREAELIPHFVTFSMREDYEPSLEYIYKALGSIFIGKYYIPCSIKPSWVEFPLECDLPKEIVAHLIETFYCEDALEDYEERYVSLKLRLLFPVEKLISYDTEEVSIKIFKEEIADESSSPFSEEDSF